MRNTKVAFAIAFAASTILWIATSITSKRVEPWDASSYWTVSYPLAIVLAGLLGYIAPARPWRWAVVIMYTQLIVMFGLGSDLSLLPLGLILLGILAVPAVVVAKGAAWMRTRRRAA